MTSPFSAASATTTGALARYHAWPVVIVAARRPPPTASTPPDADRYSVIAYDRDFARLRLALELEAVAVLDPVEQHGTHLDAELLCLRFGLEIMPHLEQGKVLPDVDQLH